MAAGYLRMAGIEFSESAAAILIYSQILFEYRNIQRYRASRMPKRNVGIAVLLDKSLARSVFQFPNSKNILPADSILAESVFFLVYR